MSLFVSLGVRLFGNVDPPVRVLVPHVAIRDEVHPAPVVRLVAVLRGARAISARRQLEREGPQRGFSKVVQDPSPRALQVVVLGLGREVVHHVLAGHVVDVVARAELVPFLHDGLQTPFLMPPPLVRLHLLNQPSRHAGREVGSLADVVSHREAVRRGLVREATGEDAG